MPVVFVCSNCGHALEVYVGGSSTGVPTLENVLQYYECPYCHAKLIPDIDMVDIEVYVWKPEIIEKIAKDDIDEKMKKKLMSTEKGRKLLKIRPALVKVVDAYKRRVKSENIKKAIRGNKK